MKFKKRIAIILILSLFITSSVFTLTGARALESEEDEDLFLLTERTDEEEEIETRLIFD
ncbi:MAG: hypothetical protein GPJ51_08740, partial [Candidatus Heimdallarchaeota archaeon]|nr:hypothetical protein [Candidatus Heimdallarchaeota archaeon]